MTWSGIYDLNSSYSIPEGDTWLVQNTVAGERSALRFGSGTATNGSLNITGGTLILKATGTINDLFVGRDSGTGTLTMTSGTISFQVEGTKYNRLYVGYQASGTINQSGGVVDVGNGSMNIGVFGGSGVYNLSGSSVLNAGVTTYLGDGTGGNGLINVSGSARLNFLKGDTGLRIGSAGSQGIIRQNGSHSIVTINNPARTQFGTTGYGAYELIDGTLDVNPTQHGVVFGESVGSHGAFIQSGGFAHFQGKAVTIGNSGTGTFTVSGGTARATVNLILASSGSGIGILNLNQGGTLEVSGTNGIQKGAGTATVNFNGGELRVVNTNFSSTVAISLNGDSSSKINTNGLNASLFGEISGTGHLEKHGEGSLTLLAANSYTGTTDVYGGTLVVAMGAQTGSGAVTVAVNGTLNGSGEIQGSATIYGTLIPGRLVFNQGLAFGATAQTDLTISGTDPGMFNTLNVTSGELLVDGTLNLNITTLLEEGFSINLYNLSGGVAANGNFASVLLSGAYGSGSFVSNDSQWTLSLGDTAFVFDAGTGNLQALAIPEPGTCALLVTALAGGAFILRRRRTA